MSNTSPYVKPKRINSLVNFVSELYMTLTCYIVFLFQMAISRLKWCNGYTALLHWKVLCNIDFKNPVGKWIVENCCTCKRNIFPRYNFFSFLTPAPKAGVIVVACAVQVAAAAAGTNLVGVPQTKPMHWFTLTFGHINHKRS